MKKIHSILALLAIIITVASCGDENSNEIDYSKPRTWNVTVLNHIVNTTTGEVNGLSLNSQQIVWTLSSDKGTFQFSPTLLVNIDGNERAFSTSSIMATNSEENPNIYSFNGVDLNDAKQFTGMINPMEQTLYWRYLVDGNYRVISTPQVITTSSSMLTTADYGDTIAYDSTSVYVIKIDPSKMTANVSLNNFTNVKKKRTYTRITMNGIPTEATAEGYEINLDAGIATAVYIASNRKQQSEIYDISKLKIIIDLNSNAVHVKFNMTDASKKDFTITSAGSMYI